MELETQTILALDLEFLTEETGRALSTHTVEVIRILNGLINHFQQEVRV
jgi:four helix bundle protein